MKRKTYLTPTTEQTLIIMGTHLLDVSMPKGTGGGNVPEAKEMELFEKEPAEVGGRFNIWDD